MLMSLYDLMPYFFNLGTTPGPNVCDVFLSTNIIVIISMMSIYDIRCVLGILIDFLMYQLKLEPFIVLVHI